jgi:nitrate reductase NapA
MKNGRFDKVGDFTEVSRERAFDEMERQFKRHYSKLGPTGVGIMGSGQYTIPEGYAAVKLAKAGWRTNNIDPNARHCMASAVAAFMQVYGIDEPAGCYDDIELTDTVVTWGANMAEMHPMLWARVVDHRLRSKDVKVINLTTYSNRTSECADHELVIAPQSDLAIWNFIAREIVKRNAVDTDFVNRHCVFATGPTDIGYGMPGTDERGFPTERDTLTRQRVVTLTTDEAIG